MNEVSLREQILKALENERKEEEAKKEKEYEKHVEIMKKDIDEFAEKLKSYCLENKLLNVSIFYRVKYSSGFGFFGVPISDNKIVISGWCMTEIEEAWKKLLEKWYFTESGKHLFLGISKAVLEKEFSFEHKIESYLKEKVRFEVL